MAEAVTPSHPIISQRNPSKPDKGKQDKKIWKLLCLHTAPGQPELREAEGEESEIVEGRIRIEKFDDDEQEGEVVGEEEEGEEEGGEVEEEG